MNRLSQIPGRAWIGMRVRRCASAVAGGPLRALTVAVVAVSPATSWAADAAPPVDVARPSSGVASLAGLRFPPGSRVEPMADRAWLYGAPLQVLVFDAPVNAPALIRILTRQQPALADLQVLPGQAILSGRVGDALWVAQVASPETGRSVGSISSIHALAAPVGDTPAWLPMPARLRLDFAVLEGGVKVSEHIWQHPLPPARLALLLQQGLLRDGWQRADNELGGAGRQSWRRLGARLQWTLVPLDAGSGLWVRRWTP